MGNEQGFLDGLSVKFAKERNGGIGAAFQPSDAGRTLTQDFVLGWDSVAPLALGIVLTDGLAGAAPDGRRDGRRDDPAVAPPGSQPWSCTRP